MIKTTTNSDRVKTLSSRAVAWRENLRTFRVASWLGWQVEGNWADPLVFFIFTILRPMATALILVFMVQVIRGGQKDGFFTYIYLSNAFFQLVIATMAGMAWAIMDDRENYRMLKYIYTSPARKFAYLVGRAVAKVVIGLITIFVLLAIGIAALGLNLDLGQVQWGWLFVYFVLGMATLLGLGIVLAGVALVIARHGGSIGEVMAGSLLLFTGAVYPVDILPPFLKDVSLGVPVTYWLEGMRRAVNGGILTMTTTVGGKAVTTPVSPALAAFDNWQILAILALSALLSVVASVLFYRWVERQAKERGMIDRITGY